MTYNYSYIKLLSIDRENETAEMSDSSSPGREELIVDLSEDVTTGPEGGVILSRAGTSDIEGSVRYRTSSAGTTGAKSESPITINDDFIEVQVRPYKYSIEHSYAYGLHHHMYII